MTKQVSALGHAHPPQELTVHDPQNPLSVVNLVPPVVRQAIQDHEFEHPEFFNVPESDLYKQITHDACRPTATDNRLRLKFWMEYDRAMARGESKMNMVNVLAGICSREMFYGNYLKKHQKVAWLVCPPTGYMIKAEEALEFGLEQLRDLLEQPHIVGGKVDTKLGELKAKIVMALDARVKGAIVQRTMNLNVNTSNDQIAKATAAGTMEDLQKQLKELERRNRIAQNVPLPPDEKFDSAKDVDAT